MCLLIHLELDGLLIAKPRLLCSGSDKTEAVLPLTSLVPVPLAPAGHKFCPHCSSVVTTGHGWLYAGWLPNYFSF